jgi:translation initiation factor 2 beta subunit (eIF-2beta)/eIF-5
MSDIARSLGRPPACKYAINYLMSRGSIMVAVILIIEFNYLDATKFFGCELGAQVKCDEKNDRYIVNGAHEAAKLQELLDVFIKKFVLCAGCTNPETDLVRRQLAFQH